MDTIDTENTINNIDLDELTKELHYEFAELNRVVKEEVEKINSFKETK